MSAQTKEQQFVAYSSYNKPVSETSVPVDAVEEWLNRFPEKRVENKPNNGIIQSTSSVIFVDMYKAAKSAKEIKAARAKAQKEHREAMRNLAQANSNISKEIERQRKIWKREEDAKAKAADKERRDRAYQDLRNERKRIKHAELAKTKVVNKKPKAPTTRSKRRDAIEAALLRGETIQYISFLRGDSKAQMAAHKLQRADLIAIAEKFAESGKSIVRIKCIGADESFFVLDSLVRYKCKRKLKPAMRKTDDHKEALNIIKSGKLLLADDVINMSTRSVMINRFAENCEFDIYSVFSKGELMGWVRLIEQA